MTAFARIVVLEDQLGVALGEPAPNLLSRIATCEEMLGIATGGTNRALLERIAALEHDLDIGPSEHLAAALVESFNITGRKRACGPR